MPMQRQTHVAVWLRMLAEKEIRAARVAKKLFIAQGKAAKEAYLSGGALSVEQKINQGADEWARVLVANYATTIRAFADYTLKQLTGKSNKTHFIDIVQGFIAKEGFMKSKLITKTSVKVAKDIIASGVEAGIGEVQIAKNLNKSLGGTLGTQRARTIARTETHNAATFAMQAQAEQTEIPMTREWVAVEDERTRDAHAEVDGMTRGMDEPFEVNGELLDRPGEGSAENSINCRCTLIYTPQDFSF